MDNSLFDAYLTEATLNRADKNRNRVHEGELHSQLVNTALRAKYPVQFSYPHVTVSVGAGWIPVLEEVCDKFQILMNANPGFIIQILQIKEKFGGLRVYVRNFSVNEQSQANIDESTGEPALAEKHEWLLHEVDGIITCAENECATRCEVCGEPGILRQTLTGFIHNACEVHARS